MTSLSQPLPLEDTWIDVLGKAKHGIQMTDEKLAATIGVSVSALQDIFDGKLPSDDMLRKLATTLGLRANALLDLAHQRYRPEPLDPDRWPNILQLPSYYMDIIVNSYLLWDLHSHEAILFDTGTDLKVIQNSLKTQKLKLKILCITHTHGDHVAILHELIEAYHPRLIAPKREPISNAALVDEGAEWMVGELKVRTLLVDGHSPGHLAYVIEGCHSWPAPVAVVGDVLFAGSMGGGRVSYQRLRTHMQTKILVLPPATLVCPGHGPTTTVEEEQKHNSFA